MQRGTCGLTRVFLRSLITGSLPDTASPHSPSVPARRCAVTLNHLRRFSSHSNMSYTIEEKGAPNTSDYRVYFRAQSGTIVSPFHDIPLHANTDTQNRVFNMVVEIPRWTNAKMEISKTDKMNPIKQDIKKGKLRFVKNIFPHHGYIWNYGAFPQTWEDPEWVCDATGTKGDMDPLDVCEIGQKVHKRGAVIKVKVLGTMCLIDEGETDWKILAIDITDPMAEDLNDVEDIEKNMPGFLNATLEWFQYYKVPDGKPVNDFAFNGKAKTREYALQVVDDSYDLWKKLVSKDNCYGITCENTCVGGSPFTITAEDAQQIVNETDCQQTQAPEDDSGVCVDKWHYPIPGKK